MIVNKVKEFQEGNHGWRYDTLCFGILTLNDIAGYLEKKAIGDRYLSKDLKDNDYSRKHMHKEKIARRIRLWLFPYKGIARAFMKVEAPKLLKKNKDLESMVHHQLDEFAIDGGLLEKCKIDPWESEKTVMIRYHRKESCGGPNCMYDPRRVGGGGDSPYD